VHVLIPLDDERGVLDPITSPLAAAGSPEKQLGCAAEFVAALVSRGFCRIYELENNQWILEVQLAGISHPQGWIH